MARRHIPFRATVCFLGRMRIATARRFGITTWGPVKHIYLDTARPSQETGISMDINLDYATLVSVDATEIAPATTNAITRYHKAMSILSFSKKPRLCLQYGYKHRRSTVPTWAHRGRTRLKFRESRWVLVWSNRLSGQGDY